MSENPTSWGAERTQKWDAFRAALLAGTDPDTAARQAGLEIEEPVR